MIEQQVYDTLKRYRICNTEEEFSIDFMDKSKKYFGVIKARGGTVSLGARVILLERIKCLEEISASQSRSPRENREHLKSMATELANLRRRLSRDLSKQCLEGFKTH